MKKILIVDYDQNCLTSIQGVLATQGYKVITAPDGQAGWDKYIKEDPDLVLMEAMLPKVHGFELCQRITSERNSQAKVFIMTGVYKDRVYRTEALRTYGAAEYFEKPLKMTELLASVEAVLGRPEPPAAEAPAEPAVVSSPAPAAVSVKPAMPAMPATAGASATARSAGPTELSATTRSTLSTESRRREKPKSDDSLFSLPEDLDRLAREIPKARKPAQPVATGPAVPEPTNGSRFDALADDLLKSVMTEAKAHKPAAPKPGPGNGNGNGKAEIDQFLASALAGLDLNKEKVKVPKTAPLPPPPATTTTTGSTTPPVVEKPAPVPPPVAAKPKPFPTPAPPVPPAPPVAAPPASAPKPAPADMKNTLTPGDPGSDVSPFFTPEKPKPAPQAVKPPAPPTPPTPATTGPSPAAKPAKPAEKTAKPGAPTVEAARPAPSATPSAAAPASSATTAATGPAKPERRPEPKPEPTPLELAQKDITPTVGGDIFEGFHAAEQKASGGFPKIIPIAIGVVALAAAGFILLKPKRQSPAPVASRETAQLQTPLQPKNEQSSQPSGADPSTTAGTNANNAPGTNAASGSPAAAKTEPKPAPVKQKAQPKAKPADTSSSGIDAILPILPASTELAPPAGRPGSGTNTPPSETGQAQTGDPAAKTAAEPPPAANDGGGTASNAETSAAGAGGTPIVASVKEGDLVELSSVTEPPKLVKSADPVYPQTAQRLGVSGSITVNALIDEKGNVIDTGILKGIQDDKGLGRAAETAVRKWKFQPARKNGVAVKVWKSFVIAFKADQNPANRME